MKTPCTNRKDKCRWRLFGSIGQPHSSHRQLQRWRHCRGSPYTPWLQRFTITKIAFMRINYYLRMQILSIDEKSTFLLPWQISSLSGFVKSSNSKPSLHLKILKCHDCVMTASTRFPKSPVCEGSARHPVVSVRLGPGWHQLQPPVNKLGVCRFALLVGLLRSSALHFAAAQTLPAYWRSLCCISEHVHDHLQCARDQESPHGLCLPCHHLLCSS